MVQPIPVLGNRLGLASGGRQPPGRLCQDWTYAIRGLTPLSPDTRFCR